MLAELSWAMRGLLMGENDFLNYSEVIVKDKQGFA